MTHVERPNYQHAEAEYRKRDREGRRCDGNSRRCTSRVTKQHMVRRKNADGTLQEPELKQTCGRHEPQFARSVLWELISTSRMGGKEWPTT